MDGTMSLKYGWLDEVGAATEATRRVLMEDLWRRPTMKELADAITAQVYNYCVSMNEAEMEQSP